MGWLSQIRSLFFIDDAPAPPVQVEQRNAGNPMQYDGWHGWGDFGYASRAGITVNRMVALSVPAIWAAVDTICKTLASLPFGLFEQTAQGSKKAKFHPVYHLFQTDPAPDFALYTPYAFKYALFAQACFGDAFAKIHRNGIGRPTNLELLDESTVTLWQNNDGSIYYVVRRTVGNRYVEEILLPNEILHIKGLTLNGMQGEDVTRIHADSIGTSVAAEQFGNYFFSNGANPSGAIVFPNELKQGQREIVERKITEKYAGVDKTGRLMILDAGVKYEKMGINPGEAMLNETRNFQVNQASRIFGVPVPLLAQLDKATLNNMEQMGIQFVTLCLRPWAVQAEQEFARKLLTYNEQRSESHFFRFNFNGLLRGNTVDRGAYYKQALGGPSTGIGWMTVNEVRELENLDHVPDGDEVFTAEKVMQAQNAGNEKVEEQETDKPEGEKETDNGTPQASK